MDAPTIACLKLLQDVNCLKYIDHPYCKPFMRYVMEWPHHLPIKTIIIGQNPYPGDIFGEYGSAFAYDDNKVKNSTPSVRVLAEDLYNHDKTNKTDTINCFRESWRLLECGVIVINESVFHRIAKDIERPNTGLMREMESQIRALQVLLSVGYNMGQTSVTLIGMGIGAAMMTSVIRPWCPSDLISAKVITCSNPAAFSSLLSDSSSHRVTLGKKPISKVLSDIVKSYLKMPPKNAAAEKRRKQHTDTLNKAVQEVRDSANVEMNELRSFKDRLSRIDISNMTKGDVDDLMASIDSQIKAKDRSSNAISAHSITMLTILDVVSKEHSVQSNQQYGGGSSVPQQSSLAPPSTPSPGPRRRVVRRSTSATPQVEPIPEDDGSDVVSTQSLVKPTTRSRRRVSRAPSAAGSEYTMASDAGETEPSTNYDMDRSESTHMNTFSEWLKNNHSDDLSLSVIIKDAADSRTTSNPLSKDILEYVRSRKQDDNMYDPYDELSDPDSESTKWIVEYMKNNDS